ncbi:MAG TPA: glutamate racemase [Candidatus Paceibacterota bacterium]|jgi:glutamate racemase
MMKRGSVGVFDSGFGGIAILKEIEKCLPSYRYIYLGDTARTPYGTRSMEVVHQFTLEGIDFLFRQGCELVIVACNTASADALRKIQRKYLPNNYPDRRVLGVVVPLVEEALAVTQNGRVGVLATEGTVRSNKYPRELEKLSGGACVFQQAAPLLVPLVEEGEHHTKAAELILRKYLAPLRAKRIDTLLLACTHYGHLESQVKKEMGKKVNVVPAGKVVARKLKEYLLRHPEIESRLSHSKSVTFYTTDLTEKFRRVGAKLYGHPITPKKAVLGG